VAVTNPNWPLTITAVDFGDNPFDPTFNWTTFPDYSLSTGFPAYASLGGLSTVPGTSIPFFYDISDRVQNFSAASGRQYELDVNQTGEATASLLDPDEAFSPTNQFSPFYPNVKVYRRIADTALWPNAATAGNVLNSLSGFDPTFNTYALGMQLPWVYGVGGTQPLVAVNEGNINPHFETDVSSWSNTSTCVLVRSTAQAYSGSASMLVAPGVAPLAATAESDQQNTAPSRTYQASAWVYSTTGNAQFSVGIRWYQGGVFFSSSMTTPVTIAAGRWVPLTTLVSAPIGTTSASLVVTNSGVGLLNTDTFFVDAAFLGESVLHCVQWTTQAGTVAQGVEVQVPCVVGTQYTTSVYVRQSTGSTQQISVPTLGVSGTSTTLPGQSYAGLSVTFTATLPNHAVRVATAGSALAGTVEISNVQHEVGAVASVFQSWGPTVATNLLNALSGFSPILTTVYAGFDPSFNIYPTAPATTFINQSTDWPGAVNTYAYVVDSPSR
jgi:hypothetical protein